jgi:4-hydroxy-tetrahydrodipicolinate synthase
MVGTGAAAAADAAELTLLAGELGFCGALVLPPFYYKGISDDGLLRYFSIILHGRNVSIPIYLYNFPALSGVQYTPSFVDRALKAFGERIVGLKDSSGDMTYARKIASRPGFDVFPSSEACLTDARAGAFAGCISATANVNSIHCGKAYRDGDTKSLARATRIRELFAGKPLVAGVKALASRIRKDGALEEVFPPLRRWPDDEKEQLFRDYDQIAEAEIQRADS